MKLRAETMRVYVASFNLCFGNAIIYDVWKNVYRLSIQLKIANKKTETDKCCVKKEYSQLISIM